MFGTKLITIAATVALAIGATTTTTDASTFRVKVHASHHKQAAGKCPSGQSPMSVEGVEGVFCVEGQACVADIDGECPVPQKGLEFGAYCDVVKTGVMGCKPYKSWDEWLETTRRTARRARRSTTTTTSATTTRRRLSVEGVEGIFCVKGQACVANTNGTCPEPQDGLEFGAYCDKVKTGVFGCKPKAAPVTQKPSKKALKQHKQNGNCQAGWSPMSVEGVQGVFCVQGQACVANKDGACPGPRTVSRTARTAARSRRASRAASLARLLASTTRRPLSTSRPRSAARTSRR
ncbi:hypothetical protein PINS_up020990 [Pythium insidiosum]|nr:hypothetical protein PINS_up020990 [Pythium insidiosum]